jgi:hypothetical protein
MSNSTVGGNGKIVTDELVLYLDAANPNSYISGATWKDISSKKVQNLNWGITPTYTNEFAGTFLFDSTLSHYGTTATPSIQTSPNLWTIDGWIKPTGTSGYIISPSANGSDQSIYWSSPSIVTQVCSGTDTNVRYRVVSAGITVGKWFHFSISIDNLEILVYINGILRGTWNETLSIGAWTGTWNLGRRSIGTSYYTGYMSNLKIYSKKLTADERMINYTALKGRFGII